MKTILFVFESKKSLNQSKNLTRDVLYYGYGFKINSCLNEEIDFDKINKDDEYLLVFTEVPPTTTNYKHRRLEGLNAIDITEAINECLVFN